MASRYWVQGTGNWSDDTNHWAASSGGAPAGGNLPTSSDDVFIDSQSGFGGGGTITLDIIGELNDFTSNSGHNYTFTAAAHKAPEIYGSIVLESGLTFGGTIELDLSSLGSQTFTSNGCIPQNVNWGLNGGTYTLQDDLTIDYILVFGGTFDANNHGITTTSCDFTLPNSQTIRMGSGTWTLTSNDVDVGQSIWTLDASVTIVPETSTIKLTDTTANDKTFAGGGKTYNNLWIAGNGTGTFILADGNTFADLKTDPKNTVKFMQGTTTAVSTFTATGTSGNLILLNSVNGVDQFTLSKASGIVSCDYLDLSNSNATGGALWYAGDNSLNTLNNSGWLFRSFTTTTTSTTTSSTTSSSTSTSTSTSTTSSSSSSTSSTTTLQYNQPIPTIDFQSRPKIPAI